jgi:hypothetical protein
MYFIAPATNNCVGCDGGAGKGLDIKVQSHNCCPRCSALDVQIISGDCLILDKLVFALDGFLDLTEQEQESQTVLLNATYPSIKKSLEAKDTIVEVALHYCEAAKIKKLALPPPRGRLQMDCKHLDDNFYYHSTMARSMLEVASSDLSSDCREQIKSAKEILADRNFYMRGEEKVEEVFTYPPDSPFLAELPDYSALVYTRYTHCAAPSKGVVVTRVDIPCHFHARGDADAKIKPGIFPLNIFFGKYNGQFVEEPGDDDFKSIYIGKLKPSDGNLAVFSKNIASYLSNKYEKVPAALYKSLIPHIGDEMKLLQTIKDFTPATPVKGKTGQSFDCKVPGCTDKHSTKEKAANHSKGVKAPAKKGNKRKNAPKPKGDGSFSKLLKTSFGTRNIADVLKILGKVRQIKSDQKYDFAKCAPLFSNGVLLPGNSGKDIVIQ